MVRGTYDVLHYVVLLSLGTREHMVLNIHGVLGF